MTYFLECSSDIDEFVKTHPILEDYKLKIKNMEYEPNYYYKGNIEDIRKKLQSFFLRYPNYTDEQIIIATQKYINSMNGDYTYLKLLKYFIWKSEVKDGEQVVTSILSDYIENEGQEDNLRNDWTSTLR